MLLQMQITSCQRGRMGDECLCKGAFKGHMFVSVGHVACGRHKECNSSRRCAQTRPDEERDMIFSLARANLHSIDPAGQTVRYSQGKVRRPAGVLEVVVMEVKRSVLVRSLREILLATAPVMTRYAACGHINALAMEAVSGRVDRDA